MTFSTATSSQTLVLDDSSKLIMLYYSPVADLLQLQATTSAIVYTDVTSTLFMYTWDTVAETFNKRIYCPSVNTGYTVTYTKQSDITYVLGDAAIVVTIP